MTHSVSIGGRIIGGGHPVLVQSMTNTRTADVDNTVRQILAMEDEGVDLVRCAIPTMDDAMAIPAIKKKIHVPLIADIHFDHRLAITAIEQGADKVRINPGNIGERTRVEAVVDAAKKRGIPIRVGVNSGSIHREYLETFGGVTPEAIASSALDEVRVVEECGFDDIVISIKATDIPVMIEAHKILVEKTNHPIHIGVTESGIPEEGIIKSSVGIGALLAMGIGDTIRVSLSGDPVLEVRAGIRILRALHLRRGGIEVISCPTCGRTEIDLIGLAAKVTEQVRGIDKELTVAVMGCPVNGPGEAKEADLGVAGGKGCGLLFRKGEVVAKLPEEELLPALMKEIKDWEET